MVLITNVDFITFSLSFSIKSQSLIAFHALAFSFQWPLTPDNGAFGTHVTFFVSTDIVNAIALRILSETASAFTFV